MQSIVPIDCDYLFPRFAAAYLLVEKNRAAFVETNTTHAVPRLLSALEGRKMTPEQVEFVIVTHVHLDHAGGSSALLRACPGATLLAHPRAAVHLRDPSRLVASARQVYGADEFDRLYGNIDPIAADRIREMSDGETLKWGSREWRFLHTRGHANHHFCVWDSALKGVFTGDAFGLCYPDLQKSGLYVFPSTSPTDFNAEQARASIRKVVELGAEAAYLTHFGKVTNIPGAASQLVDWIDFSEQLLESAIRSSRADSELGSYCLQAIDQRFTGELTARGLMRPDIWEMIRLDRELNAAGLAHVAAKRRSALR